MPFKQNLHILFVEAKQILINDFNEHFIRISPVGTWQQDHFVMSDIVTQIDTKKEQIYLLSSGSELGHTLLMRTQQLAIVISACKS